MTPWPLPGALPHHGGGLIKAPSSKRRRLAGCEGKLLKPAAVSSQEAGGRSVLDGVRALRSNGNGVVEGLNKRAKASFGMLTYHGIPSP